MHLGHVELLSDSIIGVRVLFEIFDLSRDVPIFLSDNYPDVVELVELGLFLRFVTCLEIQILLLITLLILELVVSKFVFERLILP